ncbi:MAG: hypothetical protein Q7R80_00485 [bacterium]|nr:hypothetical protein [bacterium]
MTTTIERMTPSPMNIGPTGLLFYGRVSAAAAARTRGGVLRWFPSS